eukprot:3787114-Rhodomonas_salina.5
MTMIARPSYQALHQIFESLQVGMIDKIRSYLCIFEKGKSPTVPGSPRGYPGTRVPGYPGTGVHVPGYLVSASGPGWKFLGIRCSGTSYSGTPCTRELGGNCEMCTGYMPVTVKNVTFALLEGPVMPPAQGGGAGTLYPGTRVQFKFAGNSYA